ncbi:MAG: anti-sigma F factor [Coprobacillus sp.]|nr:anti-sigma F factor [Coprobacillus sp.]MDY4145826.1 anti-sigma F factor [Bacilli bacterium]CCY08012.1 anti-sigma F factor [Coprobacillus sp. CAG:698]
MKKFINCEFNADLKNVIVSRGIIASFFMDEDVNINIINEVKTIVSEAVTNAIIHGYKNGEGIVGLNIDYDNNVLKIEVIDKGVGIENIEEARTPLFSTGSSKERAGLGFTIMDIFSDKLEIFSKVNEGTKVAITKYIA